MKGEIIATVDEPAAEPLRTEPITADDLAAGRLRIPLESASLLPEENREVSVVLRGIEASGHWQVVLAGDGDGLGSLTFDPSLLSQLAEVDDSLILTEATDNQVFID